MMLYIFYMYVSYIVFCKYSVIAHFQRSESSYGLRRFSPQNHYILYFYWKFLRVATEHNVL